MAKSLGMSSAEPEKESEENVSDKEQETKPDEEPTENKDDVRKTDEEDETKKDVEDESGGDEEETEDKTITDLRAELANKDAEISKLKEETKKESDEGEEKETKTDKIVIEPVDFLGEDDLIDITSDKEALNELLNKVYKQGIEFAQRLNESSIKSMPNVIRYNMKLMSDLQKLSDQFYKDNSDLEPYRETVANVFEKVASENTGKKFEDILGEVEKQVREKINLVKKASNGNNKKNPNLPKKKGRSGVITEPPDTSGMANEIDAMNKTLRR
jgi:hypothetical protein